VKGMFSGRIANIQTRHRQEQSADLLQLRLLRLACFRMGMSGSASFHEVRKFWCFRYKVCQSSDEKLLTWNPERQRPLPSAR
jgi:hypothetical protein